MIDNKTINCITLPLHKATRLDSSVVRVLDLKYGGCGFDSLAGHSNNL